jgi:hypothetical protein
LDAKHIENLMAGSRKIDKNILIIYYMDLCKIIDDPYMKEIVIIEPCSRSNSKKRKLLIKLIENKAMEIQARRLSLIAIGNARLLHWYEALGFMLISDKPIPDSSYKVYSMRKYLW